MPDRTSTIRMEFYNYIRFFTVYFVFSMILLNVHIGLSIVSVQNLLVGVYLVAFIGISYTKNYKNWIDIFQYIIFIAPLFAIPEWFLSNTLNVLSFTYKTDYSIGGVPFFLIGMWMISLFLIIYSAITFNKKYKNKLKLNLLLLVISTFLYVLSDEMISQISLWYYHDVKLLGKLPLFMIFPNLLLGFLIYYSYDYVKEKAIHTKIFIALLVMLIRLLLIIIFYNIFENIF